MLKEVDIINAYKEFKKTDSNRKKVQVGENIYVDFKRGKKGNITGSLFLRGTYIKKFFNKNILTIDEIKFYYDRNKNLKIRNFDNLLKKVKKTKEEINELKYENVSVKLDRIDKYKEEFFKSLEKRKIREDTIKRHKRRFEKIVVPFFKNKNLLIKNEDLVEFCNYVLDNLEYRGASATRSKNGCASLMEMISLLRLFYRFLLSKNLVTEKIASVVENFKYKKYFDFCEKQGKSVPLKHFKTLREAREFYKFLQELKEEIELWFKGEGDDEYLTMLLGYKNKKLLNESRLNTFLHRVLITEFLMLTGLRGVDFFKIKENAVEIEKDEETGKEIKYIYFPKTKNSEEYYLYLTDYLFDLYMEILKTKGKCRKEDREEYLTCLTHVSYVNFCNEYFVHYRKIDMNPHGFRHTLRTLTEEYLSFSKAVVEAQLGHIYAGMDNHYLQSKLKFKRLELLEQYRTMLSNDKQYAFIYDRKDTLKREIFDFLQSLSIKYGATINEVEGLLKEIKEGNAFQ